MTEEQIERAVERKVDALDARWMNMNNKMTQSEYDFEMKKIVHWADIEYRFRVGND